MHTNDNEEAARRVAGRAVDLPADILAAIAAVEPGAECFGPNIVSLAKRRHRSDPQR